MRADPGKEPRFFGQPAQTARLMVYGLLAVVLMAMDHRGGYVSDTRKFLENGVEPVYHIVEWPFRASRNLYEQFQTRRSLRHQNEALQKQVLLQQAELQRLDTLVRENERLRALFEGAEGLAYDYRFAELLRVNLDPFSHKVVIDRGEVDGVVEGQAVIDGAGVMGQVENVYRHFSAVRLISDPNHALPVQFNRTGLRTVAFGSGETGLLMLPNVPLQADVRAGDLVVTSGLGERFPGGYPVARVVDIDREVGKTFTTVRAEPLAALDRGREVLLISQRPGEPMDDALDEPGPGQTETGESETVETGPVETGPVETGPGETAAAELGAEQAGAAPQQEQEGEQ